MSKNKDKVLATNVWVDGEFYAEGARPPAEVAEQITHPDAWKKADKADDSADGGQGGSGYGGMVKKELQAEIDKRNQDRNEADQIKPDGTKNDDLVAALEADDAAHVDG